MRFEIGFHSFILEISFSMVPFLFAIEIKGVYKAHHDT